jgi:hypothetical protein
LRSGRAISTRRNKVRFPRKTTRALAKILSAGQKETEMAGMFERHQIITTQKNLYKLGALPTFAW